MERTASLSTSHLSDRQCWGLVKIYLNSILACIVYTRGLLPSNSSCFQVRHLSQFDDIIKSNEIDLYQAFSVLDEPDTMDSQEFRILVCSSSEKANRILDILENSIVPAIQQGLVETLKIVVFIDTSGEMAISESYTFYFTYNNKKITETKADSGSKINFNATHAHQGLAAGIRFVLRSMKGLPCLPRRRSIGIVLSFSDSCPHDFQPHGFVDMLDLGERREKISRSELWIKNSITIANFRPEALNISMVAENAWHTPKLPVPDMQDTLMSVQIHRMQRASPINLDLASTLPGYEVTGPEGSIRAYEPLRKAGGTFSLQGGTSQKNEKCQRQAPEQCMESKSYASR